MIRIKIVLSKFQSLATLLPYMNAYKNKIENEDEKMEFLNIGSELGLFKNQTTDKDWEELNFVSSMDRKLHGGDIDLGIISPPPSCCLLLNKFQGHC